jgi:hypothetical protein
MASEYDPIHYVRKLRKLPSQTIFTAVSILIWGFLIGLIVGKLYSIFVLRYIQSRDLEIDEGEIEDKVEEIDRRIKQAEYVKIWLEKVEIVMYSLIVTWIGWMIYTHSSAIQISSTCFTWIIIISLCIIWFYVLSGINQSTLVHLNSHVKIFYKNIASSPNDPAFLLSSLDPYLKLAMTVEASEEIPSSTCCTLECTKLKEVLSKDLNRYYSVLNVLKGFRWWEGWRRGERWTNTCTERFFEVIKFQMQEFDYEGGVVEEEKNQMEEWVVQVRAGKVNKKEKGVLRFATKDQTKYKVKRIIRRIVRAMTRKKK